MLSLGLLEVSFLTDLENNVNLDAQPALPVKGWPVPLLLQSSVAEFASVVRTFRRERIEVAWEQGRGLWVRVVSGGSKDGEAGLHGDAVRGIGEDFNADRGQPRAEKAQGFCGAAADVEHPSADVGSAVIDSQD